MATINLSVNGAQHAVDVSEETPLLYVLSNDLSLNGPRFGCGLGQCGACTVIVDGVAIRSCITPVEAVEGAEITTLEGLGTLDTPHPIQAAFVEEQAAGCGYCINGMIMEGKAFLDQNPKAGTADIVGALENNICRCGAHLRIVRALQRYQKEMAI